MQIVRRHGAMAARRIPNPKAGGSNPSGVKSIIFSLLNHVPVAQLDKASDYESEDWGFESLQG